MGRQTVGGFVDRVGEMIRPSDMTRDQLAARAIQNMTPGVLPLKAIEMPAAFPPERQFSPLYKELASHYGEVLGKSTYNELHQRLLDDVESLHENDVPIDKWPKGTQELLDKIN